MKHVMLVWLLLPNLAFSQDFPQSEFTFASTSPDREYGLILVAGTGACPSTRYMVLGEGVQAVSVPLTPGESVLLPLGHGFPAGDHTLTLSAQGCALSPSSARLVILNQTSPNHARAPELMQVKSLAGPSN